MSNNIFLFYDNPCLDEVHYKKDIGLILEELALQLDSKGTILVRRNAVSPNVKNIRTSLITKVWEDKAWLPEGLNRCLFFLTESLKVLRNRDIILLFHIKSIYIIPILFNVFIFRSEGKIIWKLDADRKAIEALSELTQGNIFYGVKYRILKWMMSRCSLVSTETKEGFNKLKKLYPVNYFPNGFDFKRHAIISPRSEKKPIILHCARMGSYQKNTDLLFKILSKVDLTGWEVRLVGQATPKVKESIKELNTMYHDSNPITFVGELNDETSLLSEFRDASIFILTSRFEGFPLVFTEAAAYGCYILSMEVGADKDIVGSYKYGGEVFTQDSDSKFVQALQEAMIKLPNKDVSNAIIERAKIEFNWESIVSNMLKILSDQKS
ncbi:glycosyltransferase family 4 protein [Vibrio porteresiae]|uniref:Glycosyltransferase family 4 protein n=1 Tax=Vibrio porteresiae DSM 19223 TaxID=1123496 RepID=A0ABZ0QCR2_9VIBR|nr:glycosyltransferase family 4 protein [Vibrio porteresiae]WPC74246.1 glycosyltransferase family 4 protein [Vibrio porteresiae DSM 19223]